MSLDPYEVLGLDRGASFAEVKAKYRSLAKKHHPDKNPEDKSEWIIKEVNRAYETLCDANDVRSAGQERAPRAQEDDARTWRDQADTQRERAERARQRERQAGEAERERYEQWERQQAEDARRRWERSRAKHAAREESRTEPACDACGSVVQWRTSLPLIVSLSAAWVQWALYLMVPAFIGAGLGMVFLTSLLKLSPGVFIRVFYVAFGLAFGLAFLLFRKHNPKVCPQCGCVSSSPR